MAALASGLDSDKLLLASNAANLSASAATASSGRAIIATAAALTDDAYEENDSLAAAKNLGTLSGPTTISNLVMADSADWFKFTTAAKPGTSDAVSISFQNSLGNLNLALFNSLGQQVRASSTTNNTEQVSLSGLAAGTYYVKVFGNLGATNPSYSLSIKLAAPLAPLADDAYENNDTLGTARQLGSLSSPLTISNLVMADSNDWYRFGMGAAGTSTDHVAINLQNAQGNLGLELYNASGVRLAVSNTVNNTEQISLSGRSAGAYYVHVFGVNGATNPNYSLTIDPGTTIATTGGGTTGGTTGGATGGTTSSAFNIQFRFSGLTSAEQAVFTQAAARWQSIIVGDLPAATYGGVAVDDLLIDAKGAAIDGVGNVLGEAGPDAVRSGSDLPYHGTMEFDTADLSSMLSNGSLLGVIEHEMGHVLGIGTIWTDKGLLVGAGTSNPVFVGRQATAAYDSIFGKSASGVPVENTGGSGTRDSHWRESIFGSELMTGWVGPGTKMPISRITVGSLADIGYTVNMAAADPFTPAIAASGSLLASTTSSSTSSSAGVRTVAAPTLLNDVALHDAVLTMLAGHDATSELADGSLGIVSQHAHESATDSVFTDWSMIGSTSRDWRVA